MTISGIRYQWLYVLASLLTLFGVIWLVYGAFFSDVNPMIRQRLVAIEVAPGSAGGTYMLITSEFCMDRENEAETTRIFRRLIQNSDEIEEVIETPPIRVHFLKGCHTRSRTIDLPAGIRPGTYQYQSSIRWCNQFNNCHTELLPPSLVTFDIADGRHSLKLGALETPRAR